MHDIIIAPVSTPAIAPVMAPAVTLVPVQPHGNLLVPLEPEGEAATQYITFTVGTEDYGVDIMEVREIKGWVTATRLPNAPIYVRGVINLRGTMVPIFDLRARFGGPPTEPTATHVVVILTVGRRIVGILVDAVSDILSIARAEIRPVPSMEGNNAPDFISGLATIGGRMVALLRPGRLFGFDTDTASLPN
jgi:purine-binding chemotaxis protein CheW